LPRGRITEIAGGRSTGRTGVACALTAHATRRGEIVGWVDPADALDPDTIAASGVVFRRMLWVRPRSAADAVRAAECLADAGGFGLVVLDLTDAVPTLAVPWVRCARTAERTRTTLVVLSVARRAGPHAAIGLELSVRHAQWDRGRGGPTALDGVRAALTV